MEYERFHAGVPGRPGEPGERGRQGPVFTPHVSPEGDLSWTNDGELPNPPSVNLTQDFLDYVASVRNAVAEAEAEADAVLADISSDLQNAVDEAETRGGTVIANISNDLQNAIDLAEASANETLGSISGAVRSIEAAAAEAAADAQAVVGGIEAQRDEILQSIADAAELGTDTSLSTSGMAADARAAGTRVNTNTAVAGRNSEFLGFEALTWEQGGINGNTGVNVNSAAVIRTAGFLDIYEIYRLVIKIPNGFRYKIYRYDASEAFLSSTPDITASETTVDTRTSQGRKYRFIFAASSARNIYPAEGALFGLQTFRPGDSLLRLAPNGKYLTTNIPLQNVKGVTKFPGNLYDPANVLDKYYVNFGSGTVTGDANFFATGFIPVTGGIKYRANVGRNYAWYDSSKTYLSGAKGTGIQTGITAPADAAYIRFTVSKANDTSDVFNVYFAPYDSFDPAVRIPGLIVNPAPWCYGKTINWIGDSIVDGQDFDEEVCSALGLTKLTTDGEGGNGGINGSTIALKGDGTNTRHALCLRYVDMPQNADIIAVSCGTNDFEYAWSEIGTIKSTSNTTFYGALKTLCEGLLTRYPGKLIFFTTPIKRSQPFTAGAGNNNDPDDPDSADLMPMTPFSRNKHKKTLGDYADIIKEVCGLYSIPVLDMYRESILNPHLESGRQFFAAEHDTVDGTTFDFWTHPNTAGQKIMARRVAGWLTQLGYNIT